MVYFTQQCAINSLEPGDTYVLQNWVIYGSSNRMVLNRQQAIVWTNNDSLWYSPYQVIRWVWHQAISWTSADFIAKWILRNELDLISTYKLIKVFFYFRKMHLKLLFAKWQPFSSGPKVLTKTFLFFMFCYTWLNLIICMSLCNNVRVKIHPAIWNLEAAEREQQILCLASWLLLFLQWSHTSRSTINKMVFNPCTQDWSKGNEYLPPVQ